MALILAPLYYLHDGSFLNTLYIVAKKKKRRIEGQNESQNHWVTPPGNSIQLNFCGFV